YALGLKEIWELPADAKDFTGNVIHSAGWPLSETNTTGGGFLYPISAYILYIELNQDGAEGET
ncbi:electron transfer flavoprotein-ubiquinone oxidoreductase, partial [Vibrio parahaemolyticus]|nr:electron transfer flavoprotein-ubiquinone oxidoreductase [Vibrio parahaemolyticus]